MATEVPDQPGSFGCAEAYVNSAENDDIRAEATDAEDPNTYHAWQWTILVELEYQWPEVEESEPEDEDEEEAGHMLASTAVATVAAYMISQI